MGFAATMFATGVGPVSGSLYPYSAADGYSFGLSDWTLPEEARFTVSL